MADTDEQPTIDAINDLHATMRQVLYELNQINRKLDIIDRLAIPPVFLKRIK